LLHDRSVGLDDVGDECPPAVVTAGPLHDQPWVGSAGRLGPSDPAVPACRRRQRDGVVMPSSRSTSHESSVAHESNNCSMTPGWS
jgi:hypothetical protein